MNAAQSETVVANAGVLFRREDCAGFWLRVLVDAIDFCVAFTAAFGIYFALLRVSPDDFLFQVRMLLFLLLGVWLLYFVLLKYASSRTIGYRVCRVRLVNLQGQPPTLWEVFTRALFMVMGPLNMLVDLIWLSGDPCRQALRDKFAHTYVVRRGAEPVATGRIGYFRYTIMGTNFLFQEVRAANAQGTR